MSQDVEDDVESDEEVSDDEDGEGESTFPFHDANARVDQAPARAPKTPGSRVLSHGGFPHPARVPAAAD